MHSRSLGFWRTPLIVITAALLALTPLVMAATGGQQISRPQPRSSEDSGSQVDSILAPKAVTPLKRPTLYPRGVNFWGTVGHAEAGFVPSELSDSPDVLNFNVGSFRTSGSDIAFPSDLRAPEVPRGPAYFVIQFKPSALAPGEIERSLRAIVSTGATLIEYVPQNGYIVKVDPASHAALVGSGLLQYFAPYHPGYKIAPDLGMAPLPDPDKAASSVFSLVVRGFLGESTKEIAERITSLGGTVTLAEDNADGPYLIADLEMTQIVTLSKVEGLRNIEEALPRMLMGEESAWNVIAGTYVVGVKPTLYVAGVTGDGGYLKDVDNSPAGAGNPPVAGTNDLDWNGNGFLDNAAQIIADTDTGMAVDAGDFSETSSSSGWTGAGGTAGPNVGGYPTTMHRKIAWYKTAPGFGTGDLNSCDSGASHGTVTSGQAAGNASSGPGVPATGGFPAVPPVDWSGDGSADSYGSPFFFTSGPIFYRVDGVAIGARVVFQDVNTGCPESASFALGNYGTLLTDARGKGARIHTISFGAFNGTSTSYDASAAAIDTFLQTDINRDYMLFIAAGNQGSSTTNTFPNPKALTVDNEGSNKNGITVGANLSGSTGALNTRAGFSSVGPAPNGQICTTQISNGGAYPSNCGRIKPDVMAPGQEGNLGLSESFNCISNDNDQLSPVFCLSLTGNSGTSFSTPNAAGTGALIRDYFGQGLYPDGTSVNPGNSADRKSKISGALVKAMVIASADCMEGGGLNDKYDHRFTPEQGYGFVNLRNVLPLINDPLTPTGLIVHDAGTPAGVTGPSNFSLPLTLGQSATALQTFQVVDANQGLRCALAWIEPQNQALLNDLNLELRYCGSDGNCATTGGVCARGFLPGNNNGVACTADSTCTGGGVCNQDKIYYGNAYTSDVNDDGTQDLNLDGTAGLSLPGTVGHWRDEGCWSLANVDANLDGTATGGDQILPRDTRNSTEAIYLSNDPEGDGTDTNHYNDNQVFTGTWQLKLAHTSVGTDAQKYALVCSGGLTVDSSIRLDRNPITCNDDVAVIVSEVLKAASIDPGCCDPALGGGCPASPNNCTAATISSRVTVEVSKTSPARNLALPCNQDPSCLDKETGLTFTKDPAAFSFTTIRIPVSTVVGGDRDGNPTATPILLAGDGYVVTATYNDVVQPPPGNISAKSTQAVFDCTPNVDFFQIGQPGRNSKFLLAGGCDTDKYFDNGEVFTYLVQFANLEDTLVLINVEITLRAVVPDTDNDTDPGRLNNDTSTFVTIPNPTVVIDKVDPGITETASFTVSVLGAPAWGGSPAPPPEVELVVGISAPKAGKSAATYGVFRHLLNADDEEFLYSTDYPGGNIVDRDLNNDEKISNPIRDTRLPFPTGAQRGNVDKLNESITFASMLPENGSFNGPWDFDANDEGFRSGLYFQSKGNTVEITNWGEDQNYSNTLDGPYICQDSPGQLCTCPTNPVGGCIDAACPAGAHNRKCMHDEDFEGDQDGTLDQNWGLTGACGFMTSGTAKGQWHTGTISTAPPANCAGFSEANCESFDTVPGTALVNLWWEFLRTPVVNKVHPNRCAASPFAKCRSFLDCPANGECKSPDPRGLDYRVELRDWRWNTNADYQDGLVVYSWEWDEDTENLEPVDLTDGFILSSQSDGLGPISNGNVNLTQGFPMYVKNDDTIDAEPYGQRNGTNTQTPNRNRAADRSCFFNSLSNVEANRLLRLPKPEDDDCDNEVNLGSDGCPGTCGKDDDADGRVDNVEEGCPCFSRNDGLDNDSDGRVDEPDERQRFFRCSGATTTFCKSTGVGTDDCPVSGQCGHFGDGRPQAYGDDTCGDGRLDETLSTQWTDQAGSPSPVGENGHRISQNQNWDIGTVNGPFLRFQTLEDVYDREAGNQFQGALGFLVFEGSPGFPATPSYGVAVDDMTVEWAELHPIQQPNGLGCGGGTCASGPRAGKLCFNADDCGTGLCTGGASTRSACAAIGWGTTTLFSGAGKVSLNVTDFNAQTTQGGFDCTKHRKPDGTFFSTPGPTECCNGGAGACSNGTCNDCDNDGLKEVEVSVSTLGEPNPELFRLEQTASGSASYTADVTFSSSLNAANDGVIFMQFNGTANPQARAIYFDKDSGAADVNADGTPDSPPSNGIDKCPGFCHYDDNLNATGLDKRAGAASVDDDNNGICNFLSGNAGAFCTVNSNCTLGGKCLFVDEPDETCGRICVGGTGLCSSGSATPGAVCPPSPCTGGSCSRANCVSNIDCPGGGTCGAGTCYINGLAGTPSTCTADSGCVGGYCGANAPLGDDICTNIDEASERCAIVSGKLANGIDDNCGCSENPLAAVLTGVFDNADLIVQSYTFADNGDNDGFADDNELITMNLTVRNISSFDIDDVKVRLTTQSSTIGCINDALATYGRINSLKFKTNTDVNEDGTLDASPDLLQFTIAPNVTRTLLAQIKQGTLTITATGVAIMPDGSRVPISGTSTPQNITFDLDLDVAGGTPAAATASRSFSFEPSQYATGAAWDADWGHVAVTDHAGLHCQYNNPGNPDASGVPIGCYLQQDTPALVPPDDWHLHSTVGGGLQSDGGRDSGTPGTCTLGKFPGSACSQPQDCVGGCTGAHAGQNCATAADCTGTCNNPGFPNINCTTNARCRFCINDPGITCVTSGACSAVGGSCSSAGTCTGIGTCTSPAPGTCNGIGNACMHEGFHSGAVNFDTIHLDNIFFAYYPKATGLQLGLGRVGTDDPLVLDFWQQVSVTDDRMFSNLSPPYSGDAAIVSVLTDRDNDGTQEVGPPTNVLLDGFWEKRLPFYGLPTQQKFPFGNCNYDPDDDSNNEDDLFDTRTPQNNRPMGPSSTCYPEFIWACVGDTQDPPYSQIGQTEPTDVCFPEIDALGRKVVRQGNGPGRWVEAKFDLYQYRGRKVWIRFLTTSIQFGFPTWTAAFSNNPTAGNRDDGWYIDDIKISGVAPATFNLQADLKTPPNSGCPSTLCGSPTAITGRFTGGTYLNRHDGIDNDGNGIIDEVDEGAYNAVTTDAPLRNIELDAQDFNPSVGTCISGVLQYRFWADRNSPPNGILDAGELIRDWSEDPRTTACSLCSETIKMDVRCSSAPTAPSCQSTASLVVTVNGNIGPFIGVEVDPTKENLIWPAQIQATGYDVSYFRVLTPQFDGDFSVFKALGQRPTAEDNACTPVSPPYRSCHNSAPPAQSPFDISCLTNPLAGQVDMFDVRARGGNWVATWNEGGNQLGNRDTEITANVCP